MDLLVPLRILLCKVSVPNWELGQWILEEAPKTMLNPVQQTLFKPPYKVQGGLVLTASTRSRARSRPCPLGVLILWRRKMSTQLP